MADEPPFICPDCGAPYERVRMWNGGNPQDYDVPTCDCKAERVYAEWEARRAR